ncbi:hypothetical protein Pelo_12338 [Pelomyxa schiedti]|nr:hypothetical protein Pelo_12338 [Pelomyxa schiedti]
MEKITVGFVSSTTVVLVPSDFHVDKTTVTSEWNRIMYCMLQSDPSSHRPDITQEDIDMILQAIRKLVEGGVVARTDDDRGLEECVLTVHQSKVVDSLVSGFRMMVYDTGSGSYNRTVGISQNDILTVLARPGHKNFVRDFVRQLEVAKEQSLIQQQTSVSSTTASSSDSATPMCQVEREQHTTATTTPTSVPMPSDCAPHVDENPRNVHHDEDTFQPTKRPPYSMCTSNATPPPSKRSRS